MTKILDVGIGGKQIYLDKYKKNFVIGLYYDDFDKNNEALEEYIVSKETIDNNPNIQFINCDFFKYESDIKFDIIYFNQVLHCFQLEELETIVDLFTKIGNKIRQLLNKDGEIVFGFRNDGSKKYKEELNCYCHYLKFHSKIKLKNINNNIYLKKGIL